MLALWGDKVKPYFGDDLSVRTVLPARNDSNPHQTAHAWRDRTGRTQVQMPDCSIQRFIDVLQRPRAPENCSNPVRLNAAANKWEKPRLT